MFFDAAVYHAFVKDCRAIGIQCPIVPGLMCVTGVPGFVKMTKFCKTRVPPALKERVEHATDTTQIGIDIGTELCQQVLSGGSELPPALHFYTLNLEKVVYGILQNLGWMERTVKSNEADAALQVATGSAWARIGDAVTTQYGTGVVVKLDSATAAAAVQLSNWVMANNQKPVAYLQKGQYKKIFATAN
jgi:methylenetetrahydrofolate reductase (NADPH)